MKKSVEKRFTDIEAALDKSAIVAITDSAGKITFVNALRDAGAKVTDTFVIFFYGVFSGAEKTLEESGIRLHARPGFATKIRNFLSAIFSSHIFLCFKTKSVLDIPHTHLSEYP